MGDIYQDDKAPESRLHDGQYSIISAPINVGDDVWIGAGVTVLPGVTIGSGSVIGAGSVVTKDIPPMVVAAGTPCRVLRAITDADRHVWPDERGGVISCQTTMMKR